MSVTINIKTLWDICGTVAYTSLWVIPILAILWAGIKNRQTLWGSRGDIFKGTAAICAFIFLSIHLCKFISQDRSERRANVQRQMDEELKRRTQDEEERTLRAALPGLWMPLFKTLTRCQSYDSKLAAITIFAKREARWEPSLPAEGLDLILHQLDFVTADRYDAIIGLLRPFVTSLPLIESKEQRESWHRSEKIAEQPIITKNGEMTREDVQEEFNDMLHEAQMENQAKMLRQQTQQLVDTMIRQQQSMQQNWSAWKTVVEKVEEQ